MFNSLQLTDNVRISRYLITFVARVNHAKESRELNFEDEDTSSGGQKNGGYDSVEYEELGTTTGKVGIITSLIHICIAS